MKKKKKKNFSQYIDYVHLAFFKCKHTAIEDDIKCDFVDLLCYHGVVKMF